ncbi:MAG: metal-sensitive transcriptional regulator [Clostridiales bacterium]|jgi:DNA-binding FrmR family transcriptional regulator|nr:metal-sensitive transcriptional regulator [Clostridiales bacterium]
MTEEYKNDIDGRLATIEGHIKAVRKMIADDKYCVDVITQLLAVERAVKKTSVKILRNHLNTCIIGSAGDEEHLLKHITEFNKILEMYL